MLILSNQNDIRIIIAILDIVEIMILFLWWHAVVHFISDILHLHLKYTMHIVSVDVTKFDLASMHYTTWKILFYKFKKKKGTNFINWCYYM